MPDDKPVLRFAPSPTGKIHLGNLRAAIFNWLYARHCGGMLRLRIEDTDQVRSTPEAIKTLLECLRWMGIDFDGEPIFQSANLERHRAEACRLLEEGKAYKGIPTVSQWADSQSVVGFAALPPAFRAALEKLQAQSTTAAEEPEANSAGQQSPADRPSRLPLRLAIPPGEAGKEAVIFRLPDGESRHLEESGESVELLLHPHWPALISRDAVEFVPRTRRHTGAEDFAQLHQDLEQYATAGFKGLVLLSPEGRVLFALPGGAEAMEPGKKLAVAGAAKIKFQRRYACFHDLVKGPLKKPLDNLKNRVILRSDGFPVFHLANVVDDHDLGVTLVMRGDDHVENTYWHVLLFEALGYQTPQYAHLPMLVNARGKKLSKRDGEVYVGQYRERGFLPEALFNLLALCGWSPPEEKIASRKDPEILTRREMTEWFSLERISVTPAQFDPQAPQKLLWMNGFYLGRKSPEDLLELVKPYLRAAGVDLQAVEPAALHKIVQLAQARIRTLPEFVEATRYFFTEEATINDEDSQVRKVLRQEGVKDRLQATRALLAELEPFCATTIESALRRLAEQTGVGMTKVSQPLRVAVTGGAASPPIGETLELVGKKRVLQRIDALLDRLA